MSRASQFLDGVHQLAADQIPERLENMKLVLDAERQEEKKDQDHGMDMLMGKLKGLIRIGVVIGAFAAFLVLSACYMAHVLEIHTFAYIAGIKTWWGHLASTIFGGGLIAFLDGKAVKLGGDDAE